MVGGGEPFYLKFWSTSPRWSEIADFEPTLMTLSDLERRNSPYFALFHRIR